MHQITLLQVTQSRGIQLTRKQLYTVAHQASILYRQLSGEKPPKIQQEEEGELLEVNAYPEEFEKVLLNLIEAYATADQ
jgi:hypothetical protein